MVKKNVFPPGWDQKRVERLIAFYENQTEDEAIAEDEAAFGTGSSAKTPEMETKTETSDDGRRKKADRKKRES